MAGCECEKWKRVTRHQDSPIFFAKGLSWFVDWGEDVEEPIFECPFCGTILRPPEATDD